MIKRLYEALTEANKRAQDHVRDTITAPRTRALTTRDAAILYAIACGSRDRRLIDELSPTAAPIGVEMMNR